MKNKFLDGIVAFPTKEGITFKVFRAVKNSQPYLIENRFYTYKWNSDHIYTVIRRCLKIQAILWESRVRFARETLIMEKNNVG